MYKRREKPPVIRFSDGVASGQYKVLTNKKEIAELLEQQRGGKGSPRDDNDDPRYTMYE